MSQSHLIVRSFKDVVFGTASLPAVLEGALATALPGGLHHGARTDTTTARTYGFITAKEVSREGHSGNCAFVTYEAELTIIGKQKVGDVGNIQALFATAFNMSQILPSVVGDVILIWPLTATLTEDEDQEFGNDIIVGKQSWSILIQEPQ